LFEIQNATIWNVLAIDEGLIGQAVIIYKYKML